MYTIELRYYHLKEKPEPNMDSIQATKGLLVVDHEMLRIAQEFVNTLHWVLHDSGWGEDDLDIHDSTDEDIKTILGHYPVVGVRIEAKTPATDLWLRLNTPPEARIVQDD